mmetsp:Transcript_28470/g.21277  ORF Transcript_28470/g.21277 Transcript_28470/m.21277 type:complete len:99 (-) Transcript_28470:174-470(-)
MECSFTHTPLKICENYLYGFCPEGPNCDKVHLKGVIADKDMTLRILASFPENEDFQDKNAFFGNGAFLPGLKSQQPVICHRCGKEGHKSTYCQEEQLP